MECFIDLHSLNHRLYFLIAAILHNQFTFIKDDLIGVAGTCGFGACFHDQKMFVPGLDVGVFDNVYYI